MNNLLVSISCITYNHASYIRECLDGFLMQQCNFSFEVLIHDDASTDGTQEIIKEYQEKYPDIIKPIFQVENQYSKGLRGVMARFNFPRAQGKYIALCEGDDYWTDPLKLQKQVDFLEANPEYSIIGHNRYILKNGELIESITKSWVFTQCMLFKKESLSKDFFDTIKNVFNGDTFLYYYLCMKGKSIALDFFGAVYRITGTGVYTSIDNTHRKLLYAKILYINLYKLSKKSNYIYSSKIAKKVQKELINVLINLIKTDRKDKKWKEIFNHAFALLIYGKRSGLKRILKELQ